MYGELRNIAQIRIGGYILNTMNTFRLDAYEPSAVGNVLILGNEAFNKAVITIDYRKHEMTVRTKEYDFTREASARGACVIPFKWMGANGVFPGNPVIDVKVNGRLMHFIFDTGLEGVLLTKSVSDRHFPLAKVGKATMMSPFARPESIPYVSGVTLSVGGAVFKNQVAALMPKTEFNEDGSIGRIILKSYRVTIDYPRQRILLEPYSTSPR